MYQNTKATANRTNNVAALAKQEALMLLNLANDQLPSLDVDMLKKEAQRIKDEVSLTSILMSFHLLVYQFYYTSKDLSVCAVLNLGNIEISTLNGNIFCSL